MAPPPTSLLVLGGARSGKSRHAQARAEAIEGEFAAGQVLLIDCLTLWTSNLLHAERDVPAEARRLAEALAAAAGPVILVANEVGLGIVPDNALARRFRDAAGWVNYTRSRRS